MAQSTLQIPETPEKRHHGRLARCHHMKLHHWEMLLPVAQPDFSPELEEEEGRGWGVWKGGGGWTWGGGSSLHFSTPMRPWLSGTITGQIKLMPQSTPSMCPTTQRESKRLHTKANKATKQLSD